LSPGGVGESGERIDTAIWAGPGLRWAAMGPTMLFHLGAGEGGLAAFCDRYAQSFHHWWDDMGNGQIRSNTIAQLVAGVTAQARSRTWAELYARRDQMILPLLKATAPLRNG